MSIKLIQLTDLHLLANPDTSFKGQQPWHNFLAILAEIERSGWPDLFLLTGDLSQDESLESYERLYHAMQATGVPWYWLPGNHDHIEFMQQLHPIEFSVLYNGWCFLLLNSQSGQPHGALDQAQRAAIQQLVHKQQAQPILVAVHHHPLLVGAGRLGELHHPTQESDDNIQGIDQIPLRDSGWLWQILSQQPAVKLVLCGHVHQAQQVTRDDLTLLTTPATSIQFKADVNAFELDAQKAGYRVVQLKYDGSFDTEVKRLTA